MTDELLPYYNRELAFIRDLGEEFAKSNPKIAGRLRWSGDHSEDPHVSRMIEAFAFLNARIRHKLDDDFPEITAALMGVLYPHYLAPLPSAAIVQCQLDPGQAELTAGYPVPRGSTLETEPIHGMNMPCRFRTCYDLTLWPLDVATAEYQGRPFSAPSTAASSQAAAVVRIVLKTFSEKVAIESLDLDSARFYLHGQSQYIHDLYEVVLNNCIGAAVAPAAPDARAILLPPTAIRPVGFARNEGLVDYSPRSFLGYRLLSEYFTFPEKFMFFEVAGLGEVLPQVGQQDELHLFLYLNRHLPDLERQVSADNFRLGCTPMVNLFRQRAEPIAWGHTKTEYRVVPDARRPAAHEIYTIERVTGTSPRDEQLEFVPFYSTQHAAGTEQPRAFWHATRRPAGYVGGEVDHGTEMYISLVDLDLQPAHLHNWTIHVDTICLNRDLPPRLPFGGGEPQLQLTKGGPLARIECLTAPTPTFRPDPRHRTMWQLISHLSLNHMSLFDTQAGAEPLREILRLYEPTGSVEAAAVIDGLQNVDSRRIVGRVSGPTAAGFCRGLEVTLHFDEEKFSGSGMYLFASVLERFLALYCSLNSFTKTRLRTNQRPGIVSQWPARAGEMVLA